VQQVIGSSYAGLFVDEYQDCTRAQHAIVLMLAELLPCRILGDPLQGIFGFNEDPLVDWNPTLKELSKNYLL
jgi:superfamily I DNA/RNA helicase